MEKRNSFVKYERGSVLKKHTYGINKHTDVVLLGPSDYTLEYHPEHIVRDYRVIISGYTFVEYYFEEYGDAYSFFLSMCATAQKEASYENSLLNPIEIENLFS